MRFIDLFCGIGGFRLALESSGHECVLSNDWDKFCRQTYQANFGEEPLGDIAELTSNLNSIPDHDILCAGFPCQPFSTAGVGKLTSLGRLHGFENENQGNLFFEICKILESSRPRYALLENTSNIIHHNNGGTFSVIKQALELLDYKVDYQIIDSSTLVPQRRKRCYIVASRDGYTFPAFSGDPLPLSSILDAQADDKYTISDICWNRHQQRTQKNVKHGTRLANLDKPSNTLLSTYQKDGRGILIAQKNKNPRMLTPRECARLMGFPETFIFPVSDKQTYRQLGNSLVVPIVERLAENL